MGQENSVRLGDTVRIVLQPAHLTWRPDGGGGGSGGGAEGG